MGSHQLFFIQEENLDKLIVLFICFERIFEKISTFTFFGKSNCWDVILPFLDKILLSIST